MAVLKDFHDKLNGNISSENSKFINISTMSTDSEDMDPLQYELRNIQNVIHFTRLNIDALNAKFADFQHPPSMYLTEYQELTSKLHEFEVEEHKLIEQIACGRDSPEDTISYHTECDSTIQQKYDTLNRSKVFLRAHLPNQQRTSVQVREGLTLREALAKALKLRNLVCDVCCVYRGDTNIPIPWDIDISSIDCEEITVKVLDKFPTPTSISHNFVRKTFFSLVFCECCRRLLFQGFHCRTCGYKFHQRCVSGVPTLCHQVCSNIYINTLFYFKFLIAFLFCNIFFI